MSGQGVPIVKNGKVVGWRTSVELPPAPSHLSDGAKAEWTRLGGELVLTSELDVSTLALYCQAYGRWVEAEEKLRDLTLVVVNKSGGFAQSPYLAVANKAMEQMERALSALRKPSS